MKNIPLALRQAKNNIGQTSPWLFLIDLVLLNGPTFNLVANTDDITFQGRAYTAFPFNIDLPKEANKGQIPSIKLSVSNVMRTIQGQLEALNGGIGSTVTLYIVNAGLLSEDYSELTMEFEVLDAQCTAEWCTFSLGMANPLRRRFPLYRYLALSCRWTYRDFECGMNILKDYWNLSSHEIYTVGASADITDLGSSINSGVAHIHIQRTGNTGSDKRIRCSIGATANITVDKTLGNLYTVDFKPVACSTSVEFYFIGTALSNQPNTQLMSFNFNATTKVITMFNGCTLKSSKLLEDGYYRITVLIPASFWSGTGTTCYSFVGSGWTNVGSYEYYYRRPQFTSNDTCARTFDACQQKNNVARFGGEPGLANGGVRLV